MQGEALANPALSKRTGANKSEKSPLLLLRKKSIVFSYIVKTFRRIIVQCDG